MFGEIGVEVSSNASLVQSLAMAKSFACIALNWFTAVSLEMVMSSAPETSTFAKCFEVSSCVVAMRSLSYALPMSVCHLKGDRSLCVSE